MGTRDSLPALIAGLVLAGCGQTSDTAAPFEESSGRRAVQHTTVPVDMNALDRRLYGSGQANDAADDWWAFSGSIGQDPQGVLTGTFLLANSGRDVSHFGTVTGGTFTPGALGGGSAVLNGQLTTSQAITLRFTDANSAVTPDGFGFTLGTTSFDGTVRSGVVRLLRTLPLSHGATNHAGFRFDSRIGLFVLIEDLDREAFPPPGPLPVGVLEVVRPDPVIDFREDQTGGYTSEPGADNNVPP